MVYSELLIKLMDDVINRPSKVKRSELKSLNEDETRIFMEFLQKKSREGFLEVGALIKK